MVHGRQLFETLNVRNASPLADLFNSEGGNYFLWNCEGIAFLPSKVIFKTSETILMPVPLSIIRLSLEFFSHLYY